MNIPHRVRGARNTVAVIAILAALIALGHNSGITWLLITSVGVYLGLDLSVLYKNRGGVDDARE